MMICHRFGYSCSQLRFRCFDMYVSCRPLGGTRYYTHVLSERSCLEHTTTPRPFCKRHQFCAVLTVSESTARSSHLFYPLKHWSYSKILGTASAIPYPSMPLSTPTPFGAKPAVALNSVCSLHGRSRKLPYCACAETLSTQACPQKKSKRQTSSDLPVLGRTRYILGAP